MTFYKTHDTWYISNKFTSKFILTFWLTQKPNRAEEKRKEEKIREKVCRTKKSSEKFRTTNGLLKKEIDKHGYYCQHCKHVDSRASTACRSWYITGFAQAHMNSIDSCCIDDKATIKIHNPCISKAAWVVLIWKHSFKNMLRFAFFMYFL